MNASNGHSLCSSQSNMETYKEDTHNILKIREKSQKMTNYMAAYQVKYTWVPYLFASSHFIGVNISIWRCLSSGHSGKTLYYPLSH